MNAAEQPAAGENSEGPIPNLCPSCDGFGHWLFEDSDKRKTCTECGGDGLKPGAPGKSETTDTKPHVFRLSRWGSLFHEGEFIRETGKSVFLKNWTGREKRIAKGSDIFVASTGDPDGLIFEFKKARSHLEAEVAHAQQNLADATEDFLADNGFVRSAAA